MYIFVQLFVYLFILFISHPDDGHRNSRNMLVKNNDMYLNIFMNVCLLVCDTSTNKQDAIQ
jgi:hypothetical protein